MGREDYLFIAPMWNLNWNEKGTRFPKSKSFYCTYVEFKPGLRSLAYNRVLPFYCTYVEFKQILKSWEGKTKRPFYCTYVEFKRGF